MAEAEQDPLKIFLEIFQEFLAPVGELTIAFSIMEATLTSGIRGCLRLSNDEARAIESQMQSFDSRIKLFHAVGLMQTKDEALRVELGRLVSELERLNTLRNRIMHGKWNNTATGGGMESRAAKVRHTAGKGLKHEHQYFSVSQIRNAACDMIELQFHMNRLVAQITRQRLPPAP